MCVCKWRVIQPMYVFGGTSKMGQVIAGKTAAVINNINDAFQRSRTIVSVISDTCVCVKKGRQEHSYSVKVRQETQQAFIDRHDWQHKQHDSLWYQLPKQQQVKFPLSDSSSLCLSRCPSGHCCLCPPTLWPVPAALSSCMPAHTVLWKYLVTSQSSQRYRMSLCSIQDPVHTQTSRPALLAASRAGSYNILSHWELWKVTSSTWPLIRDEQHCWTSIITIIIIIITI